MPLLVMLFACKWHASPSLMPWLVVSAWYACDSLGSDMLSYFRFLVYIFMRGKGGGGEVKGGSVVVLRRLAS